MGVGNTFLSDTAGVCSVLVLLLETCTSVPSICMQRCHKNRVWLACECDTRLYSFHLTKLIQYLSWITVSRCFVCVCVHVSPSCGMILRVTLRPASLISLTMSACGMLTMDWLFTASILSPTFSFPQRSAGLPSMMRPILWGTAVGAFTHATAGKDALGSRLEDYACLCSHTTHCLTDWLTEHVSASLILLFTSGLRKASSFSSCVCGRCTDAQSSAPDMCVTDVLWEGMYNWGARMRGASLFTKPWPYLP